LDGLDLRGNRLIELIQPAANLIARMRRQPGKLERHDMAAVFYPNNYCLSIDPGGSIQRKGEWNLFG